MDISPINHKYIKIKNGSQEFEIQTVNFRSGEDIMHLFFPEKYKVKIDEGHIIIVNNNGEEKHD